MSSVRIVTLGASPGISITPSPLPAAEGVRQAPQPVQRRVVYPGPAAPPIRPARVSREMLRAIARGQVSVAAEGLAGEVLRSAWLAAGDGDSAPSRWTGWQAAAWIATNDLAMVRRLTSPIEVVGDEDVRETLDPAVVERCLRWSVASQFCACRPAHSAACACIDLAFGKLSRAIRNGEVDEIAEHSVAAINPNNASCARFVRSQIEAVASFKLKPCVVSEEAMKTFLDRFPPLSETDAFNKQRVQFGAGAWKREAYKSWHKANRPPVARGRRRKSGAVRT